MIVQQKREADEQQKAVAAHSERISAEEGKCKQMAENAQKDLDEAIPALQEATKVWWNSCLVVSTCNLIISFVFY